MSFDILFFALNAADDAPLNAATSQAMSAVVQEHGGPSAPDQYGYFFELHDGGGVEFYAGKAVGGMLALRDLTPELCDFVFDMMGATSWMVAFQSHDLIILSRNELGPAQQRALVKDGGRVVVVSSPEDVARALAPAFGDWERYRDQVVGASEGQ